MYVVMFTGPVPLVVPIIAAEIASKDEAAAHAWASIQRPEFTKALDGHDYKGFRVEKVVGPEDFTESGAQLPDPQFGVRPQARPE